MVFILNALQPLSINTNMTFCNNTEGGDHTTSADDSIAVDCPAGPTEVIVQGRNVRKVGKFNTPCQEWYKCHHCLYHASVQVICIYVNIIVYLQIRVKFPQHQINASSESLPRPPSGKRPFPPPISRSQSEVCLFTNCNSKTQ